MARPGTHPENMAALFYILGMFGMLIWAIVGGVLGWE